MKNQWIRARGAKGLAAALAALTAMAMPLLARAAFPERPLRIVVPFTPGGGTDIIARQLAKGLTDALGQSVIVENRPGGSTIIGTENVAKSPADGYSLLMATFAHAVNPAIHKKLPYDTDKAFAPVALIGKSPNVLVVSPKSRFKSVQDILAYARAHPGKLTFGSYGNGTSAHLAGEMFKSLGKVDILHVPYKGAGPGINDLMGGQIDMIFSTSASVSGQIKNGQLRALAVSTAERSAIVPDLPSMAESGVQDFDLNSWNGYFGPAGMPPEVVARLNDAIKQVVAKPDVRKRLAGLGFDAFSSSPEAFAQFVSEQRDLWGKLIRDAGIEQQ
ncbi:tripartite tricarboxylate transporter substrate binding protein [Achromobacter xylosoxidans]|uniref:tripartite tricarboxylate transporter substrate binding protein n=1 Tax=Alcaligenes xylosoxydans xylosoxydans TaxID=85698 RepID=UPI001F110274|nr:tripartite tricarboxylate transporter substrate binding protein [Achromobacter xylosoxidans]MCH4587804.1 tripartite tricarboxylate transporter substrate binding protein [Achromobacter xylosoxidans]